MPSLKGCVDQRRSDSFHTEQVFQWLDQMGSGRASWLLLFMRYRLFGAFHFGVRFSNMYLWTIHLGLKRQCVEFRTISQNISQAFYLIPFKTCCFFMYFIVLKRDRLSELHNQQKCLLLITEIRTIRNKAFNRSVVVVRHGTKFTLHLYCTRTANL